MYISSVFQTLWRQRAFVIPATIIAGALCALVVSVSPPTYRASGSVVLLPPPTPPQPTQANPIVPPEYQNPYIRFGDVSVTVDILVRVVGSKPAMEDLLSKGFVGTAEVAANRDFYRGPIIDIAAEAPTASAAIADVELLMAEIRTRLLDMQREQETAEGYYIRVETVVGPDQATTVFSGTLRMLIFATALSSAFVVGVGVAADRLRSRARGRRLLKAELSSIATGSSVNESNGHPPAGQPAFDPNGRSPVKAVTTLTKTRGHTAMRAGND